MSEKNFPEGKIGDTVKVRIPDMDRARGDSRNIIAIILDVIDDNYKLGTKKRGDWHNYIQEINLLYVKKNSFQLQMYQISKFLFVHLSARYTSIFGDQY